MDRRVMMANWLSGAAMVSILFGCAGAGSRVGQTVRVKYAGPPLEVIALSPGGGVMSEAIGLELFNNNFHVVDPQQTSSILARSDVTEFVIAKAGNLDVLQNEGVDALLIVKSVFGNDGLPQSVTARIVNTADGVVVAGLSWQNGWGGRTGSVADRTMRKDLSGAAKEITDSLMHQLPGRDSEDQAADSPSRRNRIALGAFLLLTIGVLSN